MNDGSESELVSGFSEKVVERLRLELGDRAAKILRRLRTATVLLEQAAMDVTGLQLAESAAYNIREALNHVVEGRDPGEGGLGAVRDAWKRYETQASLPDCDIDAARNDLFEVLRKIAADDSRVSLHERKLLEYLRYRAGLDSESRVGDPASDYQKLRKEANDGLHGRIAFAQVALLQARVVAWFVRMFTPPEQVVEAIRALASQPWQSHDQIVEFERLATSDHHLRLLFAEIVDPAWLHPLRDAGIAQPPKPGTVWPVDGLLGGLAKSAPDAVADLVELLLADVRGWAREEQGAAAFELLRFAVQLGPSGRNVVAEVARRHSQLESVRSLAVHFALSVVPSDLVVCLVADAVLNHQFRRYSNDQYYASSILDHLQDGVTEGNIDEGARMLAGKTRRLAGSDTALFAILDIAPLTASLDEHPEPLLLLAHHFARMLSKARGWGLPTSTQLNWLGAMRGELRERLRGQILAGAGDIALADKIVHVVSRLASSTATAEDLALVNEIMSHAPNQDDLAPWTEALGSPSSPPSDPEDEVPRDWARAWRWAAVLPSSVLTEWQDAINRVSERHGEPDPQTLCGPRFPQEEVRFGESPYSSEKLAALPVLEAAALVAAWAPEGESERIRFGRLELARALGEAVRAERMRWSVDPPAVVRTLRVPLYIEYYVRAFLDPDSEIVDRAGAVLSAAMAQPAGGEDGGRHDDTGRDWSGVRDAVLELGGAVAHRDAELGESMNALWDTALTVVGTATTAAAPEPTMEGDPLTRAINRAWGRALGTLLALAAWESRNHGEIRAAFTRTLDAVTTVSSPAGLELRAILAAHRPLLEVIAREWLESNSSSLFRDGPMARQSFDLTVEWARPTPWLYQKFEAELFDAARRKANNAVRQIVIAALNEVDGYDIATVIRKLRNDPEVLSEAAEDAAFLVQEADEASPLLAAAIRFWELLLDAHQAGMPAQVLERLGRWAFVRNVDEGLWAGLTARTLDASDGRINQAMSVANRAAEIAPSGTSRGILLRLLDNGEPWERHHAARKALEVLRVSKTPMDESFLRLRTRLVDLGYHRAGEITPRDGRD